MISDLRKLTESANKFAFEWCGHRSTCILTSAALVYVLRELGYEAFPVRVRCSVHHPTDRKLTGTVLGSDGDGCRRPAAGQDMWHGHLAVIAENRYLLDPTVDQVGYGEHECNHWMRVPPLVAEVSERFIRGEEGFSLEQGNANLYYNVRYKQAGFLSAPDWKCKSHWMPVAQSVLKGTKSIAKQSRVT